MINTSYFHNAPTRWIVGDGLPSEKRVFDSYLVMQRTTDAQPLYWCISLNGNNVTFSERKFKDGSYIVLQRSDGRNFTVITDKKSDKPAASKRVYGFLLKKK